MRNETEPSGTIRLFVGTIYGTFCSGAVLMLNAANTAPVEDEWADLGGRRQRRHYLDPLMERNPNYSGPASRLPPDQARALLIELIAYFNLNDTYFMPSPPTGLPGTAIRGDDEDEHEVRRLLYIGYQYAIGVMRQEPRRLHNLWNEAETLSKKIAEEVARREIVWANPVLLPPRERPEQLVYFIASESGPIKIGKAANPESRCKELQTSHHERLTILATCTGGSDVETAYHRRFAAHRLNGEWFERCPELLAEIERLNQEVAA